MSCEEILVVRSEKATVLEIKSGVVLHHSHGSRLDLKQQAIFLRVEVSESVGNGLSDDVSHLVEIFICAQLQELLPREQAVSETLQDSQFVTLA